MKRMGFISRHKPTLGQIKLAHKAGYELVHFGDTDAFYMDAQDFPKTEVIAVVHPAMALNIIEKCPVAVFENADRAPEGEKPQFCATALHIYSAVHDGNGRFQVNHTEYRL